MAASINPLCRAPPQASAMPSTCVSSLPFTPKSLLNPLLSLQPKPTKLRLSLALCSCSTNLSLIPLKRRNLLSSIVSCVPETSDWDQQDVQGGEFNTTAVQDLELNPDREGLVTPEASLSDWNPSNQEVDTAEGEEDVEEGGEFSEPPEDAKLFVGNLPYDVDSERLAQLFEPAGIVEIAEVIYNRETDQSRGFGFVTMSTVEEAEKACEMLNRYDVNGRLLTVNKAAPRGTRPERPVREAGSSFTVYVGNIPWDVDSGRLEDVFGEFGTVVNANVVLDRETGRSRGFGFVTMSSESEMNDAIRALDGQSLEGRIMRVNIAQERPRRSF